LKVLLIKMLCLRMSAYARNFVLVTEFRDVI
jgi:hypothetical protein